MSVGSIKSPNSNVAAPALAPRAAPARTPFATVLRTASKAHASAPVPVPQTAEAPRARMPVTTPLASLSMIDAHRHIVGDRGIHPRKHDKREDDTKALDAHDRHLAQLAPPEGFVPTIESVPGGVQTTLHASVEALLPQLCTQIAWAREGKRNGHTQMAIGHGPLAGSSLVVTAHEGKVRVQIDAAAGVDGAAWTRRLHAALELRGLTVDHA